jgi:hypothetical protein
MYCFSGMPKIFSDFSAIPDGDHPSRSPLPRGLNVDQLSDRLK